MNSSTKSILITGGSGLLGRHLTDLLLQKGYGVSHLGRSPGKDARIKSFLWDIDKGQIDGDCINGVDIVIHLAGAGIADKRWTEERKKLIIESRAKSIELVYQLIKNKPNQVSKIISASGVGYYSDRGDELLTETSPPAHDFLGTCCVEWEQAVDGAAALGLPLLKFRTGVVLDEQGGALPQLALPVKLFAGSPIGTGKQWMPWIHWQDAVAMYLFGIEKPGLTGVYNMAAPNPVTNKQLVQAIAKQLHRPLWLPNVPAFILKIIMGEMSILALCSTKASAGKIESAGFKFAYVDIEAALKELYG